MPDAMARIEVTSPRAFAGQPAGAGEVRAMATVQGIIVPGDTVSGAEYSGHVPWMWLSLLVGGHQTPPFVADVKILSYEMYMPVLGESFTVGWQPTTPALSFGLDSTINAGDPPIHQLNLQPLEPSAPRGWSGGWYDLLPTEHDLKHRGKEYADDREVFRAAQAKGQLAEATVEWVRGSGRQPLWNSNPFRNFDICLKVSGQSHEIDRLTMPGRGEPFAGDKVWVAASPRGKDPVLDTDERFQGSARAVVWRRNATAATPG